MSDKEEKEVVELAKEIAKRIVELYELAKKYKRLTNCKVCSYKDHCSELRFDSEALALLLIITQDLIVDKLSEKHGVDYDFISTKVYNEYQIWWASKCLEGLLLGSTSVRCRTNYHI